MTQCFFLFLLGSLDHLRGLLAPLPRREENVQKSQSHFGSGVNIARPAVKIGFAPSATMATHDLPPTCKVILATGIAKSLLAEVRQGLSELNHKPRVVGFLANDDPAAKMYADWSAKTCVEK